MQMTGLQAVITLLMVALGAIATRFLPFIIFPENRPVPKYITYLGRVLPPAVIGLLVVFCLKGVRPLNYPYALPEIIAVAVTAALHWWRENVLLSIVCGTAVYMILTQFVFI